MEPETPSPRRQVRPDGRSRRAKQQQQLRLRLLFGTIVVVVAAIVVMLVLIFQGNGSTSTSTAGGTPGTGPGLTTPSALKPSQAPQLAVGTAAPDFNLATVDGKHYKLSTMRGSVVLLEYFALWCPHCQNETSTIAQLYTGFTPKGVKIFSILANPYRQDYETTGDTAPARASDVTAFAAQFKVKNPILIDPAFSSTTAMAAFSYPAIYVIDAKGIIRFADSGEVPYATLADALNHAAVNA
jgi:thiol-disulfide isomerase/thioredoxin